MIKIEEFKKVLNERFNVASEDVHCAEFAIGDLFLKTHKLKADNGIELIDDYDSTEEWNRVVNYMIDYECASAVKEELSYLLFVAEHGLAIRKVEKDKKAED